MTTPTLTRRQRKKETRARLGLSHAHPRDRRCLTCKPLPKSALTADPDYIPPPQASLFLAPAADAQPIDYQEAQIRKAAVQEQGRRAFRRAAK